MTESQQLGSFHYNFEQRSKEWLLSSTILYDDDPYPRQRGCFHHRLADGFVAAWACLCGLAVEGEELWVFVRGRRVVGRAKKGEQMQARGA
ncbi:hypothetical protein BHE74_00045369 [Ensete ventricosum]|nr:hypothetical protein GW17_00000871 [Ensete ventricosum]RWW48539.1 hypothetical protein BHE74_00045369 [Ensete ventricosum]RZS22383.1 hypothetical protein BHM03_00055149 [Ensete ventricosum]